MGRIPDIREPPGFRRIKTERDRQIIKDHVFFSEGEVMHDRLVANGNLRNAARFASFVDDDVLDMILTIRIRDGMNLALLLVGFGMRGETGGQGTGEIVRPDRVQFVGDLVR
jgi:hypothetical protein